VVPGEQTAAVEQQIPTAAAPQIAVQRANPLIRPTAAADEIAAALLTPVPAQPLPGNIPRKSAPFTLQSKHGRTGVIQYTVQQGDSLDSIAGKFGFGSYWPIVWSNSRSKINALRPGTQLNIVPEDGLYYEITDTITIRELAEKYKVDPYTIIDSEYNNLFGSIPDTLLVAAMGGVMVPGGKGEEINLLPANTSASSGGVAGVVSGSYTLWGCTADVGSGSTPLTRPLGGYRFMQDFTLGGHEAVDLAADVGDPVYAAGAGTVAYAGWNSTGYGNVVVIAHGAYFSLYAHLSSVKVRCGSTVDAGQVIGAVGNTGNSSGSHVHFEVRDANWNALNPSQFIGF
jgi:murein DD-endopeptidase MepM/ murein hydrolase activator NlpD